MFPLPPFPPLHTLREPTASASRGATLSTRIDRDISPLVPLRFVRQLRTQTAQSLVLSVKLGVRFLAAVAARVPSSNQHIPFISSLRISEFFKNGVAIYLQRRFRYSNRFFLEF